MALLPLMRRIFAFVVIEIVALMTMALSPLLMRRRPCRRQVGIVALITMAALPLICNGVVSLIVMAFCHPQAGIVALVAMASSSSLMSRRPCRHCDGIVALVVMMLLPLMRKHLCCCCDGDCCPCCDGFSAVVEVAKSLS